MPFIRNHGVDSATIFEDQDRTLSVIRHGVDRYSICIEHHPRDMPIEKHSDLSIYDLKLAHLAAIGDLAR